MIFVCWSSGGGYLIAKVRPKVARSIFAILVSLISLLSPVYPFGICVWDECTRWASQVGLSVLSGERYRFYG